ncbi:ParA family protein [Borreliella bavariensis]|uniref:ParA family protein n=1 Tax=Borreliella bavariensis TaxID=664662 RepID=UPI001BFFEB0D|nr:ParA family protein [Borreliella bavariensis]
MQKNRPIIITMASLKGGVGKSTLTILFAFILKNLHKKVLLIDVDPQNSLTSYFEQNLNDIKKYNIYRMLKEEVYFEQCINRIDDSISFIPSHPVLDDFNWEYFENKEDYLKNNLSQNMLNYNFDYILIDTPPSKDFLFQNALSAADHIIIPVQVEKWAIESLNILMEIIGKFQNIKNKIYYISIVENLFIKNRNTLKEVERALYKKYEKYIKGKIHNYNSIKIFIHEVLEPSKNEIYYKEAENALKNILTSQH